VLVIVCLVWGAIVKEFNTSLRRVDRRLDQLQEELQEQLRGVDQGLDQLQEQMLETLDECSHEETSRLKEKVTQAIMDHPSAISVATVVKDMSERRPWCYVVQVGVEHDTPEVRSALSTRIRMSGVKDEDIRSKVQFAHTERIHLL